MSEKIQNWGWLLVLIVVGAGESLIDQIYLQMGM